MRVLQLIDSLRSGGAERMAVNYANALLKQIEGSYLCCTRMEGVLKQQIMPEVGYLFLNKKSSLDLKALWRLRRFVQDHRIDFIQAHSSSWFLAVLLKLSLSSIHVVWHDHYGRDLKIRKPGPIRPASRLFSGVISVNRDLESWARHHLWCSKVRFLKNFIPQSVNPASIKGLEGKKDLNILCLANLRPQKDHFNLLTAFKILVNKRIDAALHLIGKDLNDKYSKEIKAFAADELLRENVFFYGEQFNPFSLFKDADIGVLSSSSEGLPLALLEYGQAGLPVICTRVGECAEVVKKDGLLVKPNDPSALAGAIEFYLLNKEKANLDAKNFQVRVMKKYSENAVIPEAIRFFKYLKIDLENTKEGVG